MILKTFFLFLFLAFFIIFIPTAYPVPWLGLSVPVSLAQNQLDDYNSRWEGTTIGVAFSLDTALFRWQELTLLLHGGYSWKEYRLPPSDPPWFTAAEGFLRIDNFRWGFDLRAWPLDWLYVSAGQYFSTSYYAQQGDSLTTNSITNSLLGTDIYLRLGAGVLLPLNKEWQLLFEGYYMHNMTSAYAGYEREIVLAATIRYRLL